MAAVLPAKSLTFADYSCISIIMLGAGLRTLTQLVLPLALEIVCLVRNAIPDSSVD